MRNAKQRMALNLKEWRLNNMKELSKLLGTIASLAFSI